jgi:uncharacterized protein (TIGR02646 family)
MIELELLAEPRVLAENGIAWGLEYEAALLASGVVHYRYRDEAVKNALREETRGKCAYCESKIEHVSFSHIEHIQAKSICPLLVCSWTNITLACQVCNTNKGNYFSAEAPLLNPYEDDVEVQIIFYGPMAVERTDCAKLTISKLKLNRSDLLFRRGEALRGVLQIFQLISRCGDSEAMTAALREDLQERLESDTEYSSCIRNFVRAEAPARAIEVPAVLG